MRRSEGVKGPRAAAALSALALVAALAASPALAGGEGPKTLYERLGGVATIAALMDDLIDRLYLNPVINSNPTVQEIHLKLHPSVAKFMFTEYFCQASGGPCTYIGRDMKEAHAKLGIKEAEWAAMLSELDKTLEKFEVGPDERRELKAIVDYTKADIVEAGR